MKMRKGLLMIFLVLFNSASFFAQQKSFKGMDALAQNNFGTALSLFRQDLDKHPLAAHYGLANYYQSAFALNADSAFYYLSQFEKGWSLAEPKLKLKLAEQWAISDLTIARRFYELASLELKSCDAKPSVEAYERYILRYQTFFQDSESQDRFSSKIDFQGLYQTAILQRDAVAYDLALKDGSANAMLVFVVQYPNAIQVPEAQNRYNNLLYFEKTQTGSEAALIDFIKGFPENPHRMEAWQRLYKIIEQQGTLEAYEHFVRSYPEAPQVQEAWKQVYRLYMQEYSVARLESFKVAYPDYPDFEALKQDGALLFMVFYPWLENEKFGYINQEGQLLISCQYEDASPFYDGLAIVSKQGKYGLINKRNEPVVDLVYDEILEPHDQFFIAQQQGRYGLLNQQGKTAIAFKYTEIQRLDNGQYLLEDTTGFYLLNNAAQQLSSVPMVYEEVAQYLSGLAADSLDQQIAIEQQGSSQTLVSSQLPQVFTKNGKKGLKLSNKELLPASLEDIAPFSGIYAIAKKKGKYGIIDTQGKTILNFEYGAIRFVTGLGYLIEQNALLGVYDPANGFLVPLAFEGIKPFESKYILVSLAGKDGLLDLKGKEVLAPSYQRISRFDPQTLVLVQDQKLLYFSESSRQFITRKP
jgi:hypothetical protein